MQSKNMELSEKHSSQLEELKKSDDKMVATLSELFSKALEGVNKKLKEGESIGRGRALYWYCGI